MKSKLIILALLLFTTGCGVTLQEGSGGTATPFIVTSTLAPSLTPPPTDTPLPPPPTPTPVPVEGTTSTQVNVRAQPSTAGEVLGIIPANTKVQIVGRDPGGNWWQILHPAGAGGKGWVTAQYITTATQPEVPVIGGGGPDPNNGNVAIIQQKLNVRSGPGTGFDSVGTLNPQDVVNLTGKDGNGAWLQIEFAAAPEGKGWINAAFAQAKGVENLPIVAESGAVVGTGIPTGIPPTPTVTVLPAWTDNDSPAAPAVNASLDPAGTGTLIYSGDISTPEGDPEDWVSFTSSSSVIWVSLECTGSNSVRADLLQAAVPTGLTFTCNAPGRAVDVQPGTAYFIHLEGEPFSGGVRYIRYTVTIKASP